MREYARSQGRPIIEEKMIAAMRPADSDEAGHAFQYEAGHLFRSEAGRGSDLMSATSRRRSLWVMGMIVFVCCPVKAVFMSS
jgi:hypothetical protein